MQPKLQIALDVWTLDEALHILDEVAEYVDIIEAGTALVITCGIDSLKVIKEKYPDKQFVIDAKITDEFYIAKRAFDLGADYTTVLGLVSDESISSAINEGKKSGKEVMVDLMNVKNKLQRTKEVQALGAKTVIVHCGIDEQTQGLNPLTELKVIKDDLDNISVAVAGGINIENIQKYVQAKADIIIVGGALVKNPDRALIAQKMRSVIELGDGQEA